MDVWDGGGKKMKIGKNWGRGVLNGNWKQFIIGSSFFFLATPPLLPHELSGQTRGEFSPSMMENVLKLNLTLTSYITPDLR